MSALPLGVAILPAQPPSGTAEPVQSDSDLSLLYNEANRAFAAGEYQTAAEKFEVVLKQVPPESHQQFEPLFFTLGAAYFNLKDQERASRTFQTYLEKFPKSPRITEVRFALAQTSFAARNYARACQEFLALEGAPRLRDQVMLLAAQAFREDGKPQQAIAVLERLLGPGLQSRYGVDGALLLATLHTEKHPGKARQALILADQHVSLIDNVTRLNATLVAVADRLLEKEAHSEALTLYRMVRSQDDVLQLQKERIATLETQLAAKLTAIREKPENVGNFLNTNAELKNRIEQNKVLLEHLEKMPDALAGLLLRQAQAFQGLGKKREATILYQELIDQRPGSPEQEAALHRLAVTQAELEKIPEARNACDLYLKKFPVGPNADVVEYLKGATALEAGDYADAESFFGIALERSPKGEFRERLILQLANARFAQGKFAEAREEYDRYLKEYPRGPEAEEALYRGALSYVFEGDFETAMAKLTAYLESHPAGIFAADAKYRIAVCKYAASLYAEVVTDCLAWEKEYPKDALQGEVFSLLGDAHAALDQTQEAIAAYVQSLKLAETEEVQGYVLLEGAKLLQKSGQWDRLSSTLEEFVREKPGNPLVVTAAFWLAKARSREGRETEAKTFLAETIARHINDRDSQAVEQLLTQIAQLCARRKAGETGDPLVELESLLNLPATAKAVARARILFAKAEFYKLRKDDPGQNKTLGEIASRFQPAELSAPLLATCGDFLLTKKDATGSAALFAELMESFPKSEFVDHAYCGFGDLAFAKGNYEEALGYYTRGLEDSVPVGKIKDLTVGKGRSLLALGRLDEADKIFAEIAAVREWRGDATALSVYSRGEIEMKRGDWAKAIAYFQRVYVAYRRYLPWVAKAYLRSAECFRKLGQIPEARNTYGEMLLNEKLRDFPERKEAEQKIKELGT